MGIGTSTTNNHKRKRIMVVGSTGEGKSSLVNMILGRFDAVVSDGVLGCTFECNEYETVYKEKNYSIVDTIGLNESDKGTTPHCEAVKKLVKFVKSNSDGFNLFIFVMRKGRKKPYFDSNHELFYTTLFETDVPAILFISGCERDQPLNTWINISSNAAEFKKYNFATIICGTTSDDELYKVDWEKTRDNIWNAIEAKHLSKPRAVRIRLNIIERAINIVYEFFTKKVHYEVPIANSTRLKDCLKTMGFDNEGIEEVVAAIRNHEVNDQNNG